MEDKWSAVKPAPTNAAVEVLGSRVGRKIVSSLTGSGSL